MSGRGHDADVGRKLRAQYVDKIPVMIHVPRASAAMSLIYDIWAVAVLGQPKERVASLPCHPDHSGKMLVPSTWTKTNLMHYLRIQWALPPEKGYYLTFGEDNAFPDSQMTIMQLDHLHRNWDDDQLLHLVLREESFFG